MLFTPAIRHEVTAKQVHGRCCHQSEEDHVFYIIFFAEDAVEDLPRSINEEEYGRDNSALRIGNAKGLAYGENVGAVTQLSYVRAGISKPAKKYKFFGI